ncbi:MAG: dephospho-CoA kinase [Pseudomonadota bacterium]
MLKIGLTGGVASGKSTVASAFAARGAAIIDTDLIARALVTPGQPTLAEVVARFGPTILRPDGQLDRAALRKRIFTHADERHALGAILHPRIKEEVIRQLDRREAAPYVIIVIPLLVETGHYDDILDRVLVVDAPKQTQMDRLTMRDLIDERLAQAMIAAQASRAERLARADDVIDNSDSTEALEAQIERLHRLYMGLA